MEEEWIVLINQAISQGITKEELLQWIEEKKGE